MTTKPKGLTARYFRFVLKRFRDTAGLTQEELATRMVTSHGWVGKLENGERFPNADMLFLIAKALEVRASDLVQALEDEARRQNGGDLPEELIFKRLDED